MRLQKQQVDKVLSDTRVIQKEMNKLTGKLERTFAAVENASFQVSLLVIYIEIRFFMRNKIGYWYSNAFSGRKAPRKRESAVV